MRLVTPYNFASVGPVSIHAPVKDATNVLSFRLTVVGFNPRTRKGCDANRLKDVSVSMVSIHAPVKDATVVSKRDVQLFMFQSTHP